MDPWFDSGLARAERCTFTFNLAGKHDIMFNEVSEEMEKHAGPVCFCFVHVKLWTYISRSYISRSMRETLQ